MHDCKYCKKSFDSRKLYEAHLPCPQRLRAYKPEEHKQVVRDTDGNPVDTGTREPLKLSHDKE
jgi:hypothetical protein